MFICNNKPSTAIAILNNNIEKLDNALLENISGGDGNDKPNYMYYHNRMIVGSVVGSIGAAGLVASSVAGVVCKLQSCKATKSGDIAKAAKLSKAARYLGAAAAVFAIPTIGGFTSAAVFQHKKPQLPPLDPNEEFIDPLLAEEKEDNARKIEFVEI